MKEFKQDHELEYLKAQVRRLENPDLDYNDRTVPRHASQPALVYDNGPNDLQPINLDVQGSLPLINNRNHTKT